MADLEKLRYLILSLANIQTLKIGEIDLKPDFFDEEAKYISLDKPIKTRILTAYANQSKPTTESFKKPVKQILQQRIKKEKDYIVPKNVRFGKWNPIQDDFLPGLTTTVPSMS